MIPNVFVSSTIQDLHHLRDAIRDTIIDLTYCPIMSEYGDIGYLPTVSAEDACYVSMQQCQLAVIIIGKRYGYISQNGLSITHNEFLTARTQSVPVICLIDHEVLAFKQVFEANDGADGFQAPGMDAPAKTFAFIHEVMSSPVNNGILPFTSVADARDHLKKQLAHLFGDFLRNQFGSMKGEIKDILAEIKTLRHELVERPVGQQNSYLKATRFLLEDSEKAHMYRELVDKGLRTSIDTVVPLMLNSETFDDLIKATDLQGIRIVDIDRNEKDFFSNLKSQMRDLCGNN